MEYKYIVGVDEVGRGPLAGPVYVCALSIPTENLSTILDGAPAPIRDSKKLTERMRKQWFTYLKNKRDEGLLDYRVTSVKARDLDTFGLTKSIQTCVTGALRNLVADEQRKDTLVLLDGGLHAPVEFAQKTIIRGDATEAVISLASIVAKVLRDTHMEKLHHDFPHYEFASHKGYGTKKHIESIKKYGPCEEHRLSFLKNITS